MTDRAGLGLLNRLWTTKGCRFAARERLLHTNGWSITSIAVLSTYVIIVSVTLLAFSGHLYETNEKWLNVITIGMSVLVIVFSLIEFSRDHLGTAEKINQSALKIGEIYGKLSAKLEIGEVSESDLVAFESEYAAILMDSRLNHTILDLYMFKLSNFREFDNWWSENFVYRLLSRVVFYIRAYWLYLASVLVFPVLALFWGENLLALAG